LDLNIKLADDEKSAALRYAIALGISVGI